MQVKDTIWFHGKCDRQCIRVTKHMHHVNDPLDGTITHRHRNPSFTMENRGGQYNDLMSVGDLIRRLQQCPPDARISLEDELMAVKGSTLVTLINPYLPEAEHFDSRHIMFGVSR